MIIALLHRLFSLSVNLFFLSLVSYAIFMRDPANSIFSGVHFYSGYLNYATNLLNGDLGITYNGGTPLLSMVLTVFPATLELCIMAISLSLLFGIPFGLLGAFKRDHWIGKTISGLSSLGIALPIFWLAPIALYFSAVYRWEISSVGQINLLYELPQITGFAIIDVWLEDTPYRIKIMQDLLQHLILPSLILMIAPTMEITRIVQQRASWILQQNYVKLANTRGWSICTILRSYVLHNTIPIIIPSLPRLITFILAQSMLVEGSFGWPGIGRWIIDAVTQQDYNVIAAAIMVIGLFIMAINILTECLKFILDPAGKKGWYVR